MMRLLLSSALLVALALAGCAGGSTCPSANGAAPTAGHTARFAAVASHGSVSQILLLEVDGTGNTIARITDFVGASAAQSWLDTRSRWPNMRGRGLGQTPLLTPALPSGPVVTVATESSIAQLPIPVTGIAVDAGPDAVPSTLWEWVPPELMAPGDIPVPGIVDIAVAPGGVAFVARGAVGAGGTLIGGELFALDVSDPSSVVPVTTSIDLSGYAENGLFVAPTAFAVMDGLVFAAIDHQTFDPRVPLYGTGLVAVIDPARRSLRTVLRIPSLHGCADLGRYHPIDATDTAGAHRLVVTCRGAAPMAAGTAPVDGGFAYVEYDPAHPETPPVVARTIPSGSLGLPRADGGTMPLLGHWVAYVSRGVIEPRFQERVIAANLDTGAQQILASTLPANGTSTTGFGPGAFDPASGVLVVPNGYDGVYTWAMTTDTARVEAFTFPDPQGVGITGCGHLAVREVRLVPGPSAVVTPGNDAGTLPTDASTNEDAAVVDVDAGVTDVDTGV